VARLTGCFHLLLREVGVRGIYYARHREWKIYLFDVASYESATNRISILLGADQIFI
jgi:hypothetical protein